MTLLWLQIRFWTRALLGIRDMRQGSLAVRIDEAKARRTN